MASLCGLCSHLCFGTRFRLALGVAFAAALWVGFATALELGFAFALLCAFAFALLAAVGLAFAFGFVVLGFASGEGDGARLRFRCSALAFLW